MASSRDSSGRILFGLLLIIFGVLFLLHQMGKLDFGEIISGYWPLILVFAGIWHIVSNNFRNVGGGLLLIIIGGLFQLAKFEILGESAWHYIWPALIILVGLWMVAGSFSRKRAAAAPGSKESDLDAFVIFSGLERRVESQSFRGGKATAIMGGIDLDLTQAKLAEDRAVLDLSVIMGGIDVLVPKSWRVEVDGHPLLGAIEDKHTHVPGAGGVQTLFIKASAILGGIEIKG
jgi:predicted membrane protein